MMIVCGLDLSGSGNGPVARPREYCNEYFNFVKGGNSLEIWANISVSMRYVSWGLLCGQYEQSAHSNALLMRLWQFPHHLWIKARFFPSFQPSTVCTKCAH